MPGLHFLDGPWHDATIGELSDEKGLTKVLAETKPGFYYFPAMPEDPKDHAYLARHEKGPIGLVVLAEGRAMAMQAMMARGFLLNLVASLMAAAMLSCARLQGFISRWGFVLSLGLFVGVVRDLSNWNWFYYHDAFTLVMVADQVAAWGLVGLVMAAIVTRRLPEPASEAMTAES